jgi:hypothetical protein
MNVSVTFACVLNVSVALVFTTLNEYLCGNCVSEIY